MSKKSGLIEEVQQEKPKSQPKATTWEAKQDGHSMKENPEHLQGHLSRDFKNKTKDGK